MCDNLLVVRNQALKALLDQTATRDIRPPGHVNFMNHDNENISMSFVF